MGRFPLEPDLVRQADDLVQVEVVRRAGDQQQEHTEELAADHCRRSEDNRGHNASCGHQQ